MSLKPWFHLPGPCLRAGDRAVVIGAGLAGAHCAFFLAERGIKVSVFEQADQPAQGASGNPAGVLLPFISQGHDPGSRFLAAAYGFANYCLRKAQVQPLANGEKVVHLIDQPRLRRFFDALEFMPQAYVLRQNARETEDVAGLELQSPSLRYLGACALDPRQLCRQRLQHKNIELITGQRIDALERDGQGWALYANGRPVAAHKVVVLACADSTLGLAQAGALDLRTNLGQLAFLDAEHVTRPPKAVICHRDYVIPVVPNQLLLGASFREDRGDPLLLKACEQDALVSAAAQALPGLGLDGSAPLKGRVARRTTTLDHLPSVGPLPDFDAYAIDYADLHHGKTHTYQAPKYIDGLYLSLGHGSRGLMTTPLAGWYLAAMLCQDQGLEAELVEALHPARFFMRNLKKNPIHRSN